MFYGDFRFVVEIVDDGKVKYLEDVRDLSKKGWIKVANEVFDVRVWDMFEFCFEESNDIGGVW